MTGERKMASMVRRFFASRFFHLIWYVALGLVVIASLFPHGSLAGSDMPIGRDKIARVIAFGFLTSYPIAFFDPFIKGLFLGVSMAPLGFFMEYVQKYIPGRIFSPEDMIANNIGVILGIILGIALRFVTFEIFRKKK